MSRTKLMSETRIIIALKYLTVLLHRPVERQLALATTIIRKYGLSYYTIRPPQSGYRNLSFEIVLGDGSSVNLMIFKAEAGNQARLKRADSASQLLSTHNLPARSRLDYRLISLGENSGSAGPRRLVALYTYLPGETINWNAYTKNHLKLVGMAMGVMHKVWSSPAAEQLNQVLAKQSSIYDQLEKLLENMQHYYQREDVVSAIQSKLGLQLAIDFSALRDALTLAKSLPDQHALHMDFVRSNLLFLDARIKKPHCLQIEKLALSGILDFEKVSFGSPLFDLARTRAFLLVDCKYKTAEKIKKHFLYSGYQKRGNHVLPRFHYKYKGKSINLLEELTALFLLHDFYKFLKHNPYEQLAENEHCIRTRDILESLGMVKCIS